MIFLIDYDRRFGQIRLFQRFADNERERAERLRLELELQSKDIAETEVVLLEADDEETVRKTHARYFNTAVELLRTP